MMNRLFWLRSGALLAAAVFAPAASASGYHFGSQSVSAQSTANASAAEAADPSAIFHNPAGLTRLEGTQAAVNVNLVSPNVRYENTAAYYPGGQRIQGSASGNIEPGLTVVPHVYASHRLNERVALGVGLYVPFGSGTEYPHDSVLRYNLNRLSVKTMAVQPTAAFKLDGGHSLAVGLVAQRTEAKLRQYANFGAILARGGMPGQGNGTADGYASVKGDDWGFGYNLAWLWDISDAARVGVNYRSKIRHTLEGGAEWKLTGGAFGHPLLGSRAAAGVAGAGYVPSEGASVKIVTPESLSVHGMYHISPRWSLFGDLTWTRHSRFNRVNLNFEHPKLVADPQTGSVARSSQTILNPQWRDTWKVGIGAAYQVSDPLQLRFGWAYDQSPVKSADTRMATLPDADRMWFSVGGKYDFNASHSLNLAYSYIRIHNTRADVNGWCGGRAAGAGSQACVSSRTNGSADFKSHAHMLGVQYTYKF